MRLLQDGNVMCSFSQTYLNPGLLFCRTSPGTSVPRKTFGNTKLDGVCVSWYRWYSTSLYFLLIVPRLALDLLSHPHHLFLMTSIPLFPAPPQDPIWSNPFSLPSCLWGTRPLRSFLKILTLYSNQRWNTETFSLPTPFYPLLFVYFYMEQQGQTEILKVSWDTLKTQSKISHTSKKN